MNANRDTGNAITAVFAFGSIHVAEGIDLAATPCSRSWATRMGSMEARMRSTHRTSSWDRCPPPGRNWLTSHPLTATCLGTRSG